MFRSICEGDKPIEVKVRFPFGIGTSKHVTHDDCDDCLLPSAFVVAAQ